MVQAEWRSVKAGLPEKPTATVAARVRLDLLRISQQKIAKKQKCVMLFV
jgi:hypothetical protein